MVKHNCGFSDPQNGFRLLEPEGPVLGVQVGLDSTYDPAGNDPPTLGNRKFEALIDTGADNCCIDSLLAAELGLPVVDQRTTVGVTGDKQVNVHLAQVYIPVLKFTMCGAFSGLPLEQHGIRFKALLGRSFLRYVTMTYEGRSGVVDIEV